MSDTPNDPRPTERFGNRADAYRRFRPGYPQALFDAVMAAAPPSAQGPLIVADLGSGTGISAEPFLRRGCEVYGVEPNAAMRAAGEDALASWPTFHSVAATAEATGLPPASVQIVIAGQALHWFRLAEARAEIARIADLGAVLAIFWNTRDDSASSFMQEYAGLVDRHATDFKSIFHGNVRDAEIAALFAHTVPERRFIWSEPLTYDQLRGRTLSSSYLPSSGPAGEAMLSDLETLFARFAVESVVEMHYTTGLWLGPAPHLEMGSEK